MPLRERQEGHKEDSLCLESLLRLFSVSPRSVDVFVSRPPWGLGSSFSELPTHSSGLFSVCLALTPLCSGVTGTKKALSLPGRRVLDRPGLGVLRAGFLVGRAGVGP